MFKKKKRAPREGSRLIKMSTPINKAYASNLFIPDC